MTPTPNDLEDEVAAEHEHQWRLESSGGGAVFVVDTLPQQYPYRCECGAFTHDPETGSPCQMCAPADYKARSHLEERPDDS